MANKIDGVRFMTLLPRKREITQAEEDKSLILRRALFAHLVALWITKTTTQETRHSL